MKKEFESTHSLIFEVAESVHGMLFRVGTCNGQWGSTKDSYYILSVINEQPGNGHLDDVLEWFENSCKRDNKNLLVLECFNGKFYLHLIKKHGFIPLDTDGDNVIKVFNKKAYRMLKKKGNDILVPGSLKCV